MIKREKQQEALNFNPSQIIDTKSKQGKSFTLNTMKPLFG